MLASMDSLAEILTDEEASCSGQFAEQMEKGMVRAYIILRIINKITETDWSKPTAYFTHKFIEGRQTKPTRHKPNIDQDGLGKP